MKTSISRPPKSVRRTALHAILLACVFLFGSSHIQGQQLPGHKFTNFIQANDRFGRKLLSEVHTADPTRNIALSPLPISYIFGAISQGSVMGSTIDEIRHALEWDRISPVGPSRLLLERLRPPPKLPETISRNIIRVPKERPAIRRRRNSMQDGVWMATAIMYRGNNTFHDYFMNEATDEFGMEIIKVDQRADLAPSVNHWWKDYIPKPRLTGPSDFYVAGMVHLQAVWAGNIFFASRTRPADFRLRSGTHETVDTMQSELESYYHARTDDFEAIELPCFSVRLLIVLPAEGKDIVEIERRFMDDTISIESLMKREPGTVELPRFKFEFQTDLRPTMENLGIHRVFTDLDIATIPHSKLKEVIQKVDVEVDEQGIRANAGTIANGIYGGVMGAAVPFEMKVNRPFIFLVRDNLTDSLLFVGAVMDPARH